MDPKQEELAAAIALLDQSSLQWSDEEREAWKRVRGAARRHHRDSQRVLPALGLAAQEIASAREHSQRALDAMHGVFGTPEEETAKHRKPGGDHA